MFETIISLENIFDAWTEFRRDKNNKKDVAEFEIGLEDRIFELHHALKTGTYRHGGYQSFFVCDPKRRHIHKASVCDRLVHHAIHRVIEPMWDNHFIFDSWSSRINKGTHKAVERLFDLSLALSRNHTRTLWILKLDIRKFFESIDHEVLLAIIKKKIRDERLYALLEDIIESFYPGLPLGNLTSQLCANIYLDRLDQYVKHELKVHGYMRYADDFILMHTDRGSLVDCLKKISIFLGEHLLLSLHPKKIILKTYASGIDYLGYVCFPHHRVVRTKTKQRMFNKINPKNFASYRGVLAHCRSRAIQKVLLGTVKEQRKNPNFRVDPRFS